MPDFAGQYYLLRSGHGKAPRPHSCSPIDVPFCRSCLPGETSSRKRSACPHDDAGQAHPPVPARQFKQGPRSRKKKNEFNTATCPRCTPCSPSLTSPTCPSSSCAQVLFEPCDVREASRRQGHSASVALERSETVTLLSRYEEQGTRGVAAGAKEKNFGR